MQREKVLYYLALLGRISFLYRICRFVLLDGYRHVRARGLLRAFEEVYASIRSLFIRMMLSLPSSQKKITSELAKTTQQLRLKLAPSEYPSGISITTVRSIPEHGRDKAWLAEEWRNLKLLEKDDVGEGRVSGTGGEELSSVISEAMAKFLVSNPLHPEVFPGVRKMDSEIVSMCLQLYKAPSGAGTTTSGGTESILMAVKTHRDWARAEKKITRPEMVIPSSAHAAFWKAASYFGIKLHVIPVNQETRKADVRWMNRAINANTIMLVGSAPNFPDGAVDPIPQLATIARKHGVGMHVDACLGSFIMPFLDRAGLADGIDKFDFSVPGVTSISCDIHKYGFCPKGSSVIMYRSTYLRKYQYYVITDWAGGVYASPSMAGSRPGSIIAGAWAVLNYVGADGYTDSCRTIVTAARDFASAIRARFPSDLFILGEPKVSLVAFGSKTLNIYAIGDLMGQKGWHLSALSSPPALHMAFTMLTAGKVEQLVDDLEVIISEVKKSPEGAATGDMVALYGMGQTSVGPHVIGKLAENYLDVLYE